MEAFAKVEDSCSQDPVGDSGNGARATPVPSNQQSPEGLQTGLQILDENPPNVPPPGSAPTDDQRLRACTVSAENGSVSSTSTCQHGTAQPSNSADSNPHGMQACENCGTTHAPQWRRKYRNRPDMKPTLCNACAIYFQRNHKDRPVNLFAGETPGPMQPPAMLPAKVASPVRQPAKVASPVKRQRALPVLPNAPEALLEDLADCGDDGGSADLIRRSGRQRRARCFGPEWDAIQAQPAGALGNQLKDKESVPHPESAGPGCMDLDGDSIDGGAELVAAMLSLAGSDEGTDKIKGDMEPNSSGNVEAENGPGLVSGLNQLYDVAELMAAEELLLMTKDSIGWSAYKQAAAGPDEQAPVPVPPQAGTKQQENAAAGTATATPVSAAPSGKHCTARKASSSSATVKRQRINENKLLSFVTAAIHSEQEQDAEATPGSQGCAAKSEDDSELDLSGRSPSAPPSGSRPRCGKAAAASTVGGLWHCHECRAESTAQRRRDPRNGNALCNACWARWDKAHVFDEVRKGRRSSTSRPQSCSSGKQQRAGDAAAPSEADPHKPAPPFTSPTGRPSRRAAPLPGHWAAGGRPVMVRAAADTCPPVDSLQPRSGWSALPSGDQLRHNSPAPVSLSLACDEVLESPSGSDHNTAAPAATGAGEVQSTRQAGNSQPTGCPGNPLTTALDPLHCFEPPLTPAPDLFHIAISQSLQPPAARPTTPTLRIAPLVITLPMVERTTDSAIAMDWAAPDVQQPHQPSTNVHAAASPTRTSPSAKRRLVDQQASPSKMACVRPVTSADAPGRQASPESYTEAIHLSIGCGPHHAAAMMHHFPLAVHATKQPAQPEAAVPTSPQLSQLATSDPLQSVAPAPATTPSQVPHSAEPPRVNDERPSAVWAAAPAPLAGYPHDQQLPAAGPAQLDQTWLCQGSPVTTRFAVAFRACVQEMQARGGMHPMQKKPFFLQH